MTLEVVETIYETNFRDIPTMLRERADEIEKDDDTDAAFFCKRHNDGTLMFYAWGNITETGCYVLLDRIKLHLLEGY